MSVLTTVEADGLNYAANALESNKAEIEAFLGDGVKILVADGTKLVEGVDAKLGPIASGTINAALATYGPVVVSDATAFEGSGIDAFAVFLHAQAAKLVAAPVA